ncbi:MAG: hypothetical protein ACRD6X_12390 [Pyrinomonadaceae bacterium]
MAEETKPVPNRFNPFSRFRAFLRRTFGIKSYFELGKIRPPIIICFDHIYSEYLTVKDRLAETSHNSGIDFAESLPQRRADGALSWSDVYHFQLILSDILPPEQLRTKIRRLRFDYRSVAGEKEFDDYMASKPPDLQSPPQHSEDQSKSHYEKLLRDDLKDLLGRMYLEYAILPVREERLTDLTWVAARLCLFSLISLLGILAILFIVPLIEEIVKADGDFFDRFNALGNSDKLSALTVFVVVVSGAMGGFVSALRRIQTPATDGDSLYNLALLFHGSNSVFVAPISGAIFAIIIYLLFTSATLTGTFFPAIYTPTGKFTDVTLEQASVHHPEPSPSPSPSQSASPAATEPSAGDTVPGQGQSPTPSQSPTTETKGSTAPKGPKPKPVPEQGINVFDFLARSGPGSGKDYALLIVWCFIAGFAERFVPDALDRLISRSKPTK